MVARLLRSIRSHVAQVILISLADLSHIRELREIDLQHRVFKRPMRDGYGTAARRPLSSVNLKHSNSANMIGANAVRAGLLWLRSPRSGLSPCLLSDQFSIRPSPRGSRPRSYGLSPCSPE